MPTRPAHTWDPERYLRFADERGRPFLDLLARVGATAPADVVDLGCGPGTLTALLAERWPRARVVGLDSSPAMIARAQTSQAQSSQAKSSQAKSSQAESARAGARAVFSVGDLREWSAPDGVDVLCSNATLQWLPDHLDLLPRLVEQVRPGGWLAFQVPGNFGEPSHTLRRELAAEPAYEQWTREVAVPSSHDPAVYLDALTALGCEVDAWETTYLHVLSGPDPVFTWVSGTGARPTLQALPDDLRPAFEATFRERLAAAYPPRRLPGREEPVVVLPFRRVFVVARVPQDARGGAA